MIVKLDHFPKVGVKKEHNWNHHLVDLYLTMFWTKRPLGNAEKDVKGPCEKPTWLDNVPLCKDFPQKGFHNQQAVFFTFFVPYSCSTKMISSASGFSVLPLANLDPNTFGIWSLCQCRLIAFHFAKESKSVREVRSSALGKRNDTSRPWHTNVGSYRLNFSKAELLTSPYTFAWWPLKSSSFELFWRDVFFWNGVKKGGRFGFGDRNEVILVV